MGSFIALALVVATQSGCSHVFYQPARDWFVDPAKLGHRFEEVDFHADDGVKLHGWFFPAEAGPSKATVIQFHGNAENMSTHFMSLAWLAKQGYDFFTFDYRGYGASDGEPSQEGLNRDALAAIRYVLGRTRGPVVLYGQSLGGAVLLRAFADVKDRSRIKALVIESSFHSYQAIGRGKLAQHWLTFLLQPLAWALISDAYSPEDMIAGIAPTPLLVIHGQRDQVIPPKYGEKIFELAREPKWIWRINQGRHIDSMSREKGKNRGVLLKFIETLQPVIEEQKAD